MFWIIIFIDILRSYYAKIVFNSRCSTITRFFFYKQHFYKQHFYKQHKAEICQKLSNR